MSNLDIFDVAKRNSDGDLIVKREGRFGTEHDVNLSTLFKPGKRKKADVDWLVMEARLAYENPDKERNPAFPVNERIANKVLERLEDEPYDPAWLEGPANRDDL